MTEHSGLPIFLENRPSVLCDQVLWLIKNSGLNFQVRETPFSLDINLKKCYAKIWNLKNENPVPSQPASQLFPAQSHQTAQQTQDDVKGKEELIHQIDLLKVKLKEALHDKDGACEDLLEMDKAHRKLVKENRELLKKHEQISSELKGVKLEKENTAKENNTLSVALKSSKQSLKTNFEIFEKERQGLKIELENLNKFKILKEAEQKKIKKAEKKIRQRDKKLAKENSKCVQAESEDETNDALEHNSKDFKVPFMNTIDFKDPNSNDTLENNSEVINVTTKQSEHMSDAMKGAKVEESVDVDKDISENCESKSSPLTKNISDTSKVEPIPTASAPLTKDDLKEVWEFFAERSERIKSWGGST